jgi:cytochrome c biogenesis protein CcmG/thiol:disulfide interchange protein DsbE
MKALRYLLPLIVFLGIGVFLYSGLGKDPQILPSVLVGKRAPDYSLPSLHTPGQVVSAASLRGKPYLLNVFASWCVTCRVEHPTLTALAKSGVLPVIGLNWKDPHEDAVRWLGMFGDPYTDIAVDAEGRTAIDLGVTKAPESFLIDANGTILHKVTGPITPEIIETELKPRLAALATAGAKP